LKTQANALKQFKILRYSSLSAFSKRPQNIPQKDFETASKLLPGKKKLSGSTSQSPEASSQIRDPS
jgi:hypothetical protein